MALEMRPVYRKLLSVPSALTPVVIWQTGRPLPVRGSMSPNGGVGFAGNGVQSGRIIARFRHATAALSFVFEQDVPAGSTSVGTGDGSTTEFTGTLPHTTGIVEGSVKVTTSDGLTLIDNGDGTLSGDGTGTIVYSSGALDVTFNRAPASAATIAATNSNWDAVPGLPPGSVQVSDKQIGVGDGSTTSFDATLVAPVLPGSLVVRAAGSSELLMTDDGTDGDMVGDVGSGAAVVYSTGVLVAHFSAAPNASAPVLASYVAEQPIQIGASVEYSFTASRSLLRLRGSGNGQCELVLEGDDTFDALQEAGTTLG
jgi:hypothetical protein